MIVPTLLDSYTYAGNKYSISQFFLENFVNCGVFNYEGFIFGIAWFNESDQTVAKRVSIHMTY